MKITGARALALALKKLDVKNVWGMPGARTLSIYNEFDAAGIKTTLVANELSAAFMADAFYRVSGIPGVCVSIPGPGLTNMLTGIAEAFLDSSAMLVITASPLKSEHRFHVHEIPQLDIVKPVVKKIIQISSASEIIKLFEAYYCSLLDEPGPVIVEIGSFVMDEEMKESDLDCPMPSQAMGGRILDGVVSEIVHYIKKASQVGIYAGRGCMAAGGELLKISKILSAPIATTISGRGVVPEDYELSCGYGFGRTGSPAAYRVFKRCDLILAIGVKFSEMATGGWGLKFEKMIHIDTAEENLGKNYSMLLTVPADARVALAELTKSLVGVRRPINMMAIEEIKTFRAKHAAKVNSKQRREYLHPAKFLRKLRETLPRDAIFCTDVGNHQLWSLSDFEVYESGTYLTPADYQAMGFGIPAAIGAAMARPDKTVVCICGDGGFLITGFELLTAIRENLDLSVFIFNDGALGLIKEMQKKIYNRSISVELKNPDFEQLATSFGARYFRISNDATLEEKLEEILKTKGVNIVDCAIVYDELSQFIKGSIRNSWEQASLSRKMAILYRYIKCRL